MGLGNGEEEAQAKDEEQADASASAEDAPVLESKAAEKPADADAGAEDTAAADAAPAKDAPAASDAAAADAAPATDAPAAGDAAAAEAEGAPRGRRKDRKSVPRGLAFIQSSFNNTLITLTDPNGNVISAGSAGSVGFKGSRKSTPFAAGQAAERIARKAIDNGMRQIDVRVKGTGSGREAAIRSLEAAGLSILSIRDVTPMPHNGCRARKRRRV